MGKVPKGKGLSCPHGVGVWEGPHTHRERWGSCNSKGPAPLGAQFTTHCVVPAQARAVSPSSHEKGKGHKE